MKSQQSLKNKLENVSSRMNLLKESMRQTLEEQTAKELIKNHMKSLMGFLTADDSVVERCFANLKRFLEVHKSSHLQTEASIKHCLGKNSLFNAIPCNPIYDFALFSRQIPGGAE